METTHNVAVNVRCLCRCVSCVACWMAAEAVTMDSLYKPVDDMLGGSSSWISRFPILN